MSFCGTIRERERWKMLGFAMHCSGLASQLLGLKYADELQAKGVPGNTDPQLRLFKLDNETRERFTKFAKNLRWFTTEHNIHDDNYWKGYREHEYNDYDFYVFFDQYPDTEINAAATILERVGNGERPSDDEIKTAMDFLHELSGRAHAMTDRGGCF